MNDYSRSWVVSYEEFEAVLNSPELLTVAVRGHLLIVRVLDALLTETLPSPHALEISRMSAALKLDLVAALGLVDGESCRLGHFLGKIRNRFAHDSAAAFTEPDAEELRSTLSPKHREMVVSMEERSGGGADPVEVLRCALT